MSGTPADPGAFDVAVADEVLGTIASEHRLRIVMVLGDGSAGGEYATYRFSEIRSAVGLADSGRLNYHLKQLVEREYVEHVADGYRLTLRGLKAYQAVKAGFYASDVEVDPVELDEPHDACGEPIRAFYANQRLTIECPACDVRLHQYPLPPGPFDGAALRDVLRAWNVRLKMDVCSMSRGFCPYCSGPTAREVGEEYREAIGVESSEAPGVLLWCTHCHWFLVSTMDMPLLFDPVVVSFFADRGVDVWEAPGWTSALEADHAVLAEEPLEVLLEFSWEDDTLEVVVDEDLSVVRSETRESRPGSASG